MEQRELQFECRIQIRRNFGETKNTKSQTLSCIVLWAGGQSPSCTTPPDAALRTFGGTARDKSPEVDRRSTAVVGSVCGPLPAKDET